MPGAQYRFAKQLMIAKYSVGSVCKNGGVCLFGALCTALSSAGGRLASLLARGGTLLVPHNCCPQPFRAAPCPCPLQASSQEAVTLVLNRAQVGAGAGRTWGRPGP